MIVTRLDLFALAKAARTDMLAAMELLPCDAELSRARFGVPFVVAQSFATASEVLVADADSYRKPWMIRRVIEGGLGENLFTTDGDAWRSRRQPVAPSFGVHQVNALTATMASTVSEVIEAWEPGEVDVQAAMNDLTIRIALRTLLGTNEETEELAVSVRRDFEEILEWITFKFNRPASLPAFAPTGRNRSLKTSKARLRRSIEQLMEYRRTQAGDSVDILGRLLQAQQAGTHQLSDESILDECTGFMFAGHETTASALSWALYELSLRPDVQDAVAAEAAGLDPTDPALSVRVAEMRRTGDVVDEILRLYPAGISIVRSAKRATHIGAERIRRGTVVMIPVYAIQRSAEVWDDPSTFDPSRHIPGNGPGFLPFGLGPRRCLGARFARNELRIALALICSRWRLGYNEPEPPTPIVAPSLRAAGRLPLTLAPRT